MCMLVTSQSIFSKKSGPITSQNFRGNLGGPLCEFGNIVVHGDGHFIRLFICNHGLSRSVNSRESNANIQNALTFVAPEVFRTRKFTQKSDVYSFWHYYAFDVHW